MYRGWPDLIKYRGERTKNPESLRKTILKEKREEELAELFPKEKNQTFADWIDQIKRNNFEQKHIRFDDFFTEGNGNYNNNEVT